MGTAQARGAGSQLNGNDSGGTLTLSGDLTGSAGGWYLESGDAAGGHLTGDRVTVPDGNLFGGFTAQGNAEGNTTVLTGVNVIGTMAGEFGQGAAFGGYAEGGNATGNILTISGGKAASVAGGGAISMTARPMGIV